MIKRILGITDKSIIRKSTYFVYSLSAFLGFLGIISSAGSILFRYGSTYKGMLMYHNKNIEYLKSLSKEIDNQKLLNISEFCKTKFNSLNNTYDNFDILIIILGFILIINFLLFRELKNSKIDKEK